VQIVHDALELEQAGASLLVVEAVPAAVGAVIATRASIPVIGIGAGADVDGQVLVYTDVLGLGTGHVPRFVRSYADARSVWSNALSDYVRDVRSRAFPAAAETYGMSETEFEKFKGSLS
jgi:3-methyl-2-oxobutanoate hydroxymethyltransferase